MQTPLEILQITSRKRASDSTLIRQAQVSVLEKIVDEELGTPRERNLILRMLATYAPTEKIGRIAATARTIFRNKYQ